MKYVNVILICLHQLHKIKKQLYLENLPSKVHHFDIFQVFFCFSFKKCTNWIILFRN